MKKTPEDVKEFSAEALPQTKNNAISDDKQRKKQLIKIGSMLTVTALILVFTTI